MRLLTASVVLSAMVFVAGCATFQSYPAFGTGAGGQLIKYDRRDAHNVLPPADRYRSAAPMRVPHAQPVH